MDKPLLHRYRILLYALVLATIPAGLLLWYYISYDRNSGFFRITKPPYPLADYTLQIERTICFGNCPDFTLTVNPDGGTVLDTLGDLPFDRQQREPNLRDIRYSWKIDEPRLEALVATLEEGRFWRLRSDYSRIVTDNPSTRITVTTPSRSWSVHVYAVPCQSDDWRPSTSKEPAEPVPDVFCKLAEQLDTIACDTYRQGKKSSSNDSLTPIWPPNCETPR